MEETISLKEIFEVLKKRMLLIMSLIIVAAAASAVISFFVLVPVYQANTQFVVTQEATEATPYSTNQIDTSLKLIGTYAAIIESPRIMNPVAEELNLNISAAALADKIEVGNSDNIQVVNVTATDVDPELAVAIANTTFEVFQEEIPDILNIDNVSILAEAVVGETPQQVSPNPQLNVAIAAVLGAMVGIGIAFLLEYMNNTIKTESDIENKLGMTVIGTVSHVNDADIKVEQLSPGAANRLKGGAKNGKKKKTV